MVDIFLVGCHTFNFLASGGDRRLQIMESFFCLWCTVMDPGRISSNHEVKEGFNGFQSQGRHQSHQCTVFTIEALQEVQRLQLVVLGQLFQHLLGCNFSKINLVTILWTDDLETPSVFECHRLSVSCRQEAEPSHSWSFLVNAKKLTYCKVPNHKHLITLV